MTLEQKLYGMYTQSARNADLKGYGLSGGDPLGIASSLYPYSGNQRQLGLQHMRQELGTGLSLESRMYPHSFPTPGFYPGTQGLGLSGGRKKKICRYKPKSKNPKKGPIPKALKCWLKKVSDYREKHPNLSQKEAMQKLKGK